MEHTRIVTASDLSRFSDSRNSQSIIPELLYLLIRQSVPSATECRIPFGDEIGEAGMDGLVECDVGFGEYVPAGRSCWEIGTGKGAQAKASKDFKKRTDSLSDDQRANTSFVFVSPRVGTWDEPSQSKWIEKRRNAGWASVRILDGVKLADWLSEFPAIGIWMAKNTGSIVKSSDLKTPRQHWDLIRSTGKDGEPDLPPSVYTAGRQAAVEAIDELFRGDSEKLFIFSESEGDVDDFVSAYLESLDGALSDLYSGQCLFVRGEEAWRSFAQLRSAHVLVAHPRLGIDSSSGELLAIAKEGRHRILVPLCAALAGSNPEFVTLRSATRFQLESVLREAGFTDQRARELGMVGDGRVSALRRHLDGLGSVPPYATWDTARQLAQAAMLGQWDAGNPADVEAMRRLLGKSYGEWIEGVESDALRSDAPLVSAGMKWRFVARGEGWTALGPRLSDDDINRLESTCISVLGERDPQFGLPKGDRFASRIMGKDLVHSGLLRKGLAEAVALLGSRPHALSRCTPGRAQAAAARVVHELLADADWTQWASLNAFLPLLAEAAPSQFMRAVEAAMTEGESSPMRELFAQEGPAGVQGTTYMSGVLWALEGLAWNEQFLPRVTMILAELASLDPGGSWANRPSSSLRGIYMPWHVQTTATFEVRKRSLEVVLKEYPVVGWRLLLGLLPNNHGTSSGSHKPVWREYIPHDWSGGILRAEYWEQVSELSGIAVRVAKEDVGKLIDLVSFLPSLPAAAHSAILEHLKSERVMVLPESERLPLWEVLSKMLRKHKKYSDADWAMPEDVLLEIEVAAASLQPRAPELRYRSLFVVETHELYDGVGDWGEQQARLDKERRIAVGEIFADSGVSGCLDFASVVSTPTEVGKALGLLSNGDIESSVLPSLLDREDARVAQLVVGFISTNLKASGMEWVDSLLERPWSSRQRLEFLKFLPFRSDSWERLGAYFSPSDQDEYWRTVHVAPYGLEAESEYAAEQLIAAGRGGAAVSCLGAASRRDAVDEDLAVRALHAAVEGESAFAELDQYWAVELIKQLQQSESVDRAALASIEWALLSWLDSFSSGSPVTLQRRISESPKFFAELVQYAFKSTHSSEDEGSTLTDLEQRRAENAYLLLKEWKTCPGQQDDGAVDEAALERWMREAKEMTKDSGHYEVALMQIGHALCYAPADPAGLWIDRAVARLLNERDVEAMRSGFMNELYNQRGVFSPSGGKEERAIAAGYHEKASSLDHAGFIRFGASMRQLAERYEAEAVREESPNHFES